MMLVKNAPGRTMCTMPAGAVNTASASSSRHCYNVAAIVPIFVEATDERQDKKFPSVPGDR